MPVNASIPRTRGKGKVKVVEKRKMTQKMLEDLDIEDLDVRVELIQSLIPLGLEKVAEDLKKEVNMLVGKRYKRDKENHPWGENPGSIYLQDQKTPITVPRVRNKKNNKEVPLKLYKKLQTPYKSDKKTMLKLLNGISTHKYEKSVSLVPQVFGLSSSNLSKRFKYATQEKLRELKTRSLKEHDFICIFIDAKKYADDGLIVALGVTMEGKKIVLDIAQSHTEHSSVIEELLQLLIQRGLNYKQGLLFIVDGSKGIIKAIKDKFQYYGFIQRCIWHKEQNIVSYLSKSQKELCKLKLKRAYNKTSYKEARDALSELYNELIRTNETAANSLMEGLEETLTLHKLGLSPELCKSLNSTNCMESVMSGLGQYTDKVDRWRNSNQILRWTAASLLEIEPNLKRIRGFRYLPLLRFKMQERIRKIEEKEDQDKEILKTTIELL
jgi:transposase-like protein